MKSECEKVILVSDLDLLGDLGYENSVKPLDKWKEIIAYTCLYTSKL